MKENPIHNNFTYEKKKAMKALEDAKKLNRPVKYLKQGISYDLNNLKTKSS